MPAAANALRPALGAGPLGRRLSFLLFLASAALALAAPSPDTHLATAPLAPRSGPRGATMFTALAPEQTGVITANRYADPQMWTDHYQELAYGAIGTGLAVGDYDNDGRPDLFVVSKTDGCRLFRNLGNWKFADVTERAGLAAPGDRSPADLVAAKLAGAADLPPAADAAHWKQGATFVDINNDGWLDLYVCRFGAPNLLYVNQHDGTFKEEAAARGLAITDASGMAAFCDYDRDGALDVYLVTSMLDASTHPHGQRDHLLHNRGDGTFTDATARLGGTEEAAGHSATWWDYDGDGWPDLYVANDYAAPDHLYRNNRDGTFTDVIDRTVPHTPYYSMGSDFGDVNNDGRPDFLALDMAASTHEKDQRGMAGSRARAQLNPDDSPSAPQYMRNALYVNTGTGRFLEAASLAGFPATDWTWSPRFEDLDNDGRLDLHVTNGMTREYHNADLLDRIMAVENPADSRRVVRSSPVLAETNFAFRNLGDLAFENVAAAWGLDQRGVSFGSAFADFDGDGDLDLVFANYEKGVTLLRNDSDSGHRLIVALRGLSTSLKAPSLSRGTRSNRFGVGATVRLETASGIQFRQLTLARGLLSSSEPILHFGLGADERVRRLIVAWPGGATQTFTDLAADQKLTITEPADAPLSDSDAVGAALRPDALAESRHKTAPTVEPTPQFLEVSVTTGLSLTSRQDFSPPANPQPLLPLRQIALGPALAVVDLDSDGREDLVLGGTTRDPRRLLLQTATGSFSPVQPLHPGGATSPSPDLRLRTLSGDGEVAASTSEPLDDGPVLAFDADGDSHDDLLVSKGSVRLPPGASAYQPRLLLNDGHGGFRSAAPDALPPLALSVGALAAADFDRDGHLDVFVGARVIPGKYPFPARSALLANHGGRFEDVTDLLAPGLREAGLVTSALWSDVDGDGWLDLVLALDWGGLRCWHNDAGRGFTDVSDRLGFSTAGTGWWTSLASADFNGDGRPDFVAGNLGLNTRYRASSAHPALLFYGDFGGGSPLAIEGTYEGDRLLPWLTRNELAVRLPAIAKRFARNDAYARATLGEILGEERLSRARRFAATELRSGVLLSQPDGTYRFTALPRIVQIAPLQGLVAGDFDGDGFADIYAVQNSFAPIAALGRFDGGLSQLLRGDGHGNFTAVPPAESGLVVPGDAKALVVLDLDADGWPDFVVSRNHDTTLAYRNHGVAGRHAVRISLRGPAGNPTAIGARVTLELANRSTQTIEVTAGSGYYSQSSPALFLGWTDANPPRALRVRWPSGATTEHADPAASTTKAITLSAP